ncbi:serine/threonine-protein kinase [Streptomyces sp. Je 1-369]|uniref:serine/threonine-protein kinase n=1 Tax=Streptomyces sp. Je 1-369 TaxID=2966192 RepID=UPI00228658FA|nr:serine/threonine-protein kinase [Streptomyces sp. Je 1-369]WAL98365.1 serine/threonine protein kinase [Streptomyces sp. Je 1-369]
MKAGDVLDDGRFLVEESLDQGGMGSIWKATDTTTGRTVAVKVLRLDAYTHGRLSPGERARRNAEMLKRFEREGTILAELDHPAIPRLLHRGYWSEEPYLVMEYVDGPTLREFLDQHRPLPLAAACAIAVQIAEALAHAHSHGVVHRDLKPGNIVLSRADGRVSLLDFGIAYLTDPDATRYTALGETPGSAGYIAPEQLRGLREVTAAVDRYAFGCVLFELVTAQCPFEDKPDRNKNIQHLEDLPPRMRSINSGLPQELDDLVADLLSKIPGDRPVRIEEVWEALHGLLPSPGDPAPDPALEPDPTLHYRTAGGLHPVAAPRQPSVVPRLNRRRGSWLGRGEFAALQERAKDELEATDAGPVCARLERALAQAVEDWGIADLSVAKAHLTCADAALLGGRVQRAEFLYGQVAGAPARHAVPELRALMLEAEIGVVECRIPDGDALRAVEDWTRTVREVLELSDQAASLLARCREAGLGLVDWLRSDQIDAGQIGAVTELLSHLPESCLPD